MCRKLLSYIAHWSGNNAGNIYAGNNAGNPPIGLPSPLESPLEPRDMFAETEFTEAGNSNTNTNIANNAIKGGMGGIEIVGKGGGNAKGY